MNMIMKQNTCVIVTMGAEILVIILVFVFNFFSSQRFSAAYNYTGGSRGIANILIRNTKFSSRQLKLTCSYRQNDTQN